MGPHPSYGALGLNQDNKRKYLLKASETQVLLLLKTARNSSDKLSICLFCEEIDFFVCIKNEKGIFFIETTKIKKSLSTYFQ